MGRSRPGVVLAAGMLVLAGCSGFVPADGTPTETASPAPVPSPPSPSPSLSTTPGVRLPPGVADSRVTNPGVLVRAHRDALTNASYAVRFEERTWYANGSGRSRVVSTTRVSRDGLRYLRLVRARGETNPPLFPNATQVVVYAQGGERYVRAYNGTTVRAANGTDDRRTDNGTVVRYARVDREQVEARNRASLGRPLYLFGSMELRVSRVRLDNATMYRVVSTDLLVPVFLAEALDADDQSMVENATLRALVTPGGFIREYRLNYTLVTDRTVVHGTRSVRYRSLGATVVRRPGWYEEAVNATRNATENTNG